MTPVLLGSENHPSTFDKDIVKYRKGDLLHGKGVPVICRTLPNGMIIDLPIEGIEEFVSNYLQWLNLGSDEDLVASLQTLIQSSKVQHQRDTNLRDYEILSTPFFEQQDEDTQSQIVGALQVLKHRHPKTLEEYKDEFRSKSPID